MDWVKALPSKVAKRTSRTHSGTLFGIPIFAAYVKDCPGTICPGQRWSLYTGHIVWDNGKQLHAGNMGGAYGPSPSCRCNGRMLEKGVCWTQYADVKFPFMFFSIPWGVWKCLCVDYNGRGKCWMAMQCYTIQFITL